MSGLEAAWTVLLLTHPTEAHLMGNVRLLKCLANKVHDLKNAPPHLFFIYLLSSCMGDGAVSIISGSFLIIW